MLGGRIDTQGSVEELKARGILNDIVESEVVVEHPDPEEAIEEVEDNNAHLPSITQGQTGEKKKARKLVHEEFRATGGVKWGVYKSYLKAS